MSQSATKEGTLRYTKRFSGRAAEGYFRETQGLVTSSLGIGTYLGQPDDKTDEHYTAAVVAAVENGINFIDAAINYRFQRSERSVGAAIKQLAARGIAREELILCTKGATSRRMARCLPIRTSIFSGSISSRAFSPRRTLSRGVTA